MEPYKTLMWRIGIRPIIVKCVRVSYPPQEFKHWTIKRYAKKYNSLSFIETGTYKGETVTAVLDVFEDIHSVEIVKALYDENCNRFANDEKVYLYYGDSTYMLEKMIDDVKSKDNLLFWLDGHYSGGETGKGLFETPIIQELNVIFEKLKGRRFVILIDDARCFRGGDYPVLKEFINNIKQQNIRKVTVKSDIIRIIV